MEYWRKKREYDVVVDNMPKEERDILRRNLDDLEDMEEYMEIFIFYAVNN